MFLSLTAETHTPLCDCVSTCLGLFGLVFKNKRAFSRDPRQGQDVASKQAIMLLQHYLLEEVMVSSQKLSRYDVVYADRSEIR